MISFITPRVSSFAKWADLAKSLVDPSVTDIKWPERADGNVPAAQLLYGLTSCQHVRELMKVVIDALVGKSMLVLHVYAEAKELVQPVEATQEDVDYHSDPTASNSFYYINKDGKPLYRLRPYETKETDCAGECSKKVRWPH